jgi:hypothetical protein
LPLIGEEEGEGGVVMAGTTMAAIAVAVAVAVAITAIIVSLDPPLYIHPVLAQALTLVQILAQPLVLTLVPVPVLALVFLTNM